jgi:hypothetical protein
MYKFKEFVLLKEAMGSGDIYAWVKNFTNNPQAWIPLGQQEMSSFALYLAEKALPTWKDFAKDKGDFRGKDAPNQIVRILRSGRGMDGLEHFINQINTLRIYGMHTPTVYSYADGPSDLHPTPSGTPLDRKASDALNVFLNLAEAIEWRNQQALASAVEHLRILGKISVQESQNKYQELINLQNSHKANPLTTTHFTSDVKGLAKAALNPKKAKQIHPILADALQDADYGNEHALNALRTNNNPHWVHHNIIKPIAQL